MGDLAAPALFAVLLWWAATGLVLVLQHRPRQHHARLMLAASVGLAGAFWAIRTSAGDPSEAGAYLGFSAAIAVWGWQEMSYYMGFVSGPRPVACAPSVRGLDRFFAALVHPMIHTGNGLEFGILGLVAEGKPCYTIVPPHPSEKILFTRPCADCRPRRRRRKARPALALPGAADAVRHRAPHRPPPIAHVEQEDSPGSGYCGLEEGDPCFHRSCAGSCAREGIAR